jgi:hypothetical protein
MAMRPVSNPEDHTQEPNGEYEKRFYADFYSSFDTEPESRVSRSTSNRDDEPREVVVLSQSTLDIQEILKSIDLDEVRAYVNKYDTNPPDKSMWEPRPAQGAAVKDVESSKSVRQNRIANLVKKHGVGLTATTATAILVGGAVVFANHYDNENKIYHDELNKNIVKVIEDDGFDASIQATKDDLINLPKRDEAVTGTFTRNLYIGRCVVKGTADIKWSNVGFGSYDAFDYKIPQNPFAELPSQVIVQNRSEVQQLTAYQDCFKLKDATN